MYRFWKVLLAAVLLLSPLISHAENQSQIKALTFNIWGLPDWVSSMSKIPTERMRRICTALTEAANRPDGWDVVFLQEAWRPKDRALLKQCGYPYAADRERSTWIGYDSGLLILSRFPIIQTARYTYSHNGDWSWVVRDGEALVDKAALAAQIEHPAFGKMWLVTTHLVSHYPDHAYSDERVRQMHEFAQWVAALTAGSPTIIGADFNLGPYGPTYEPLWDQVPELFHGYSQAPESKTACTFCQGNFGVHKEDGNQKIDHLLGSVQFAAVEGKVVLNQTFDSQGTKANLSDHYGWETRFEAVKTTNSTLSKNYTPVQGFSVARQPSSL